MGAWIKKATERKEKDRAPMAKAWKVYYKTEKPKLFLKQMFSVLCCLEPRISFRDLKFEKKAKRIK